MEIVKTAWTALVIGPSTGTLINRGPSEVFYLQSVQAPDPDIPVPAVPYPQSSVNVMVGQTKKFNIESGWTMYGRCANKNTADITINEDG